jgi:type III secretion protein J
MASLIILGACKMELNSRLDEQEANEMMAHLMAEGVSVSKKALKDGVTLLVDEADFGKAVEILTSHGFPRRSFSTTGDIFADQGLVASPMQEWARFNFAKAQELSQSISTIPGVVKADVHIASSRKQSAFETVSPPSASVLIQMHEDRITPDLVPQIKQLVSFSIPDIDYDRVGVIVSPVPRGQTRTELVAVLGIMMHPASVQDFRRAVMSVGIAGLAVLVLASLAGVAYWRGRRKAGDAG